eukprot:812154-Amphidinium_carterae.1
MNFPCQFQASASQDDYSASSLLSIKSAGHVVSAEICKLDAIIVTHLSSLIVSFKQVQGKTSTQHQVGLTARQC